MKDRQLEICLPVRCATNARKRRQQLRAARARWWFGKMRQVVESAAEWTPPSAGGAGSAEAAGI